MNRAVQSIPVPSGLLEIHEIKEMLQQVQQQLNEEMQAKQATITAHEREIHRLLALLEAKNQKIKETDKRLLDAERKCEGNKQLINKLLGDIDRHNQELEWYKRTYEKRSLLGTIKQKILKRD